MGITEQTCYRWKKQYVGSQSDQVRQLKQTVAEPPPLAKTFHEFSKCNASLFFLANCAASPGDILGEKSLLT